MIIRSENQKVEIMKEMANGKGEVRLNHLICSDQFCGHGRLFSVVTLEPGCSVGWHMHHGESETYYILQGKALLNDNGKEEVILNTGDVSYTASGEGHSIENIGEEPLRFVALIINA